jgi:NAD-reducing hydrogenase large subunit
VHDLVIDPVSRIEGHAKITVRLGDDGAVDDARFHVTEFRGFEELCRGRPVWEMPGLTARTCGICPVSHLLASARACDEILAVRVPPAADLQRRLANLAQIVQSHALSFFYLSAPDLLLGLDADPATRNVFGLLAAEPDLTRRGVRLRQFGQEVIAAVCGQRIHGTWIVPGGVANPLEAHTVEALAARVPEAKETALLTLERFVALLERYQAEIAVFGSFPSMFLAHCARDGTWEHYSGGLRVVDAAGALVADQLAPRDYRDFLAERSSGDTYLKTPYWRAAVHGGDVRDGMYRVGPLARLNVAERMGTPLADAALDAFRERAGRIAASSFCYHEARLVEVLGCIEQIEGLLADPRLLDTRVRAQAGVNAGRGVGASEAPRGTLFHDYEVDDDGLMSAVNMLIATGQNNLAMNATVLQIAREHIAGPEVPEGVLNRLEAGIRTYDPCLSCSTHAFGQMPFVVRVVDPRGRLLREVRRD